MAAARAPRTKPADERRADLLAAGKALFIAKGVAATTLEDVTSGAGVSKGLFYVYFRSKEDLVFALQEQFARTFADRVEAVEAMEADWPSRLDACVQACYDSFQDEHELHEVLFHHAGHAPVVPVDRPPAHTLFVGAIRSLLRGGVTAGAFQIDDVDATALLFFGVQHAFDPTFRTGELDGPRVVRATQRLMRRAVGIAEPPPPVPAVQPDPLAAAGDLTGS